MDQDEIDAIIIDAIAKLYDEDGQIIEYDVGERTLSSCLAWQLKPSFPDQNVHVEYDRRGIKPKGIELPDAERGPGHKLVFSDLNVQRPGHDDHNLLVIELKKSTSQMDDEQDHLKLDRLKYQLGGSHHLCAVGAHARCRRLGHRHC